MIDASKYRNCHFWGLHGFTGHKKDFTLLREEACISSMHSHWHLGTLPGHDEDGSGDCSIEGHKDWLKKFLNQKPVEAESKTILIAYSMGARLALLYATQQSHNLNGLILISVNPGIEDPEEKRLRAIEDVSLSETIKTIGIKKFIKFWNEQPLIQTQENAPPDFYQSMQMRKCHLSPIGLSESLRGFGQGVFPSLWESLENITIPTLLITGQKDEKYTLLNKRMKAKNKNFKHSIITDAGHAPHIESATFTALEIKKFIENNF